MDPLVCIGLRTQLKLRSLRKNLFRFGCRCETKYIASLRSQKITIHLSLLNAVLIILNIINYISKFIELTLTFGHFKVDVIRNKVIRYFKFSKMVGYLIIRWIRISKVSCLVQLVPRWDWNDSPQSVDTLFLNVSS